MTSDDMKKLDELRSEQQEHMHAYELLEEEYRKLGTRDAVGKKVTHRKFGEGTVIFQNEKYIEVQFAEVEVVKRFALPSAIADKVLSSEEEDADTYYSRCDELHQKLLKEQMQIRYIDFAIARIEEDGEDVTA